MLIILGFITYALTMHGQVKSPNDSILVVNNSALQKPKLFSNLGESFCTPDAFAIDKNDELYISVPNFNKHEVYGSKICKFNSSNQPITWLDSLPRDPKTKSVFPMGMAFGSDGNLYIADNQSSFGLAISRLLRVTIVNGKPIKTDVVVSGFNIANGVRCYKNRIYVSDTYFRVKDIYDQSGIYSFSIEELNQGMIQLKENSTDPHVLCRFTTRVFNDKHEQGGVDGITFDKQGNLYAGNFGDGVISKIELTAEGKLKSQKVIVDSETLRCCDGIYYYEKTNSIYIANFNNNSVHVLDLNKKELKLLWENGDNNGKEGLLDQPCDPVIYKNKLLIVNFDSFIGLKNTEADSFHTISYFDL